MRLVWLISKGLSGITLQFSLADGPYLVLSKKKSSEKKKEKVKKKEKKRCEMIDDYIFLERED